MKDDFALKNTEITAPALNFAAVFASDDPADDLVNVSRGIYVGVGGNVAVADINNAEVIFLNVPSGFILPVRARRVNDTNTSAGSMVALW